MELNFSFISSLVVHIDEKNVGSLKVSPKCRQIQMTYKISSKHS